MIKRFTLSTQLIILGSFFVFFYVFFAFTTSIYRDYKLETHIGQFESDIHRLESLVYNKPLEIKYYESVQYKDKYAKENLNLINPGEKVIILPQEEQLVVPQLVPDRFDADQLLKLSPRQQWWQYFFGQTLTVR